MSLANQVIDFVDDLDRSILKTASVPDTLKSANILTAEDRDSLANDQFALVIMTKEGSELKKFPINDPANTWLSCHYFSKTAHSLPFEAQKTAANALAAACALFDLEPTAQVKQAAKGNFCGNLYKEAAAGPAPVEFVKRASEGKHYYALGDKYPMPDAGYVKTAEQYFEMHWQDFEPADRYLYAKNVKARADELNVKVASVVISKFANDAFGTRLVSELSRRRELLDARPDMQTALNKLAAHTTDTDPETFAKALHLFDKKAGLDRHYDSYLKDPYQATFEDTGKIAKAKYGYTWEDTASGMSLNEAQLEKAAEDKYDKIKGYFGETVASHMKKNAVAIFESMPKDAQVVLARIARGSM
jgi:hypothetical protein